MSRRTRSLLLASIATVSLNCVASLATAADRQVAWVVADSGLERQLNVLASRDLRVVAVSEGLPQPVVAMQAPEGRAEPASYRVVGDKGLTGALPTLVDDGFVPVGSAQRAMGGAVIIFERGGAARGPLAEWRLIEFGDLDALDAGLTSAAADGFRARMLVQTPLKSWPGLSHRGLLLAEREIGRSGAREVRVIVHRSRNVDEAVKALASAAAEGFEFDLLFSNTRDGAVEGRRDRLVIALSRARGAAKAVPPVLLERNTSFGTWGRGAPRGAAPYWDEDYVFAWSPTDRRQTWASPVSLSDSQAHGVSLDLTLRVDGMDEQSSDIVGLVARPFMKDKYYLMVLTDQWMGPKPKR